MADIDEKNFEEIEGITKDLAKNLSAMRDSLKEINDETKGWEDMSKRVAFNKQAIKNSLELSESISERILKTNVEISRAESVFSQQTATQNTLLRTSASLSSDIARNQAEYNVLVKRGSRDTGRMADLQIDIERAQSNQIVINKTLNKFKENEVRYGGDVLKKMKDQVTELGAMLHGVNAITKSEKSKTKIIQTQQAIYSSLLVPLLGDTKNFGKLMDLGWNIAKGGAKRYLAILDVALERWIELDRTAEAFRKSTGLIVPQMIHIEKAVRQVNTEFAYMGVTLEKAYLAAGALYGEFQTSHLVTKDMISFTARVAENLGISADNVAEFEAKFSEIVKSSGLTTQNVIATTAALASAGGVAPKKVMEDMAKASGAILSSLARNPMALMRAAVEARRMGTTLENMGKSARGLLNYQESMTSELEASALLNQNISFQRARQLAWEGKIEKSREEALRQISKAGDFTRLNVYQQEALAKAAGMTVDEVVKQQNQQKLLNNLRRTNPALVAEYDKMLAKTKLTGKAAEDAANKEYEIMIKKQLMQAELTKLTNSLTAAWIHISDALLPIENAIMPPILFMVRALAGSFKLIGSFIRGMLGPLDSFAKRFRLGEEGSEKMEKVLGKISKVVDNLAPSFEFFGKVIAYSLIPLMGITALLMTHSRLWTIITTHIAKSYLMFQRFSQGITSGVSGIKKISMTLHDVSNTVRTFGTEIKSLGGVFRPFGYIINLFGRFGTEIAKVATAINNFSKGASAAARFVAFLGGAINYLIIKPLQIVARVMTWVISGFSGLATAASGLGVVSRILGPILRFLSPIGWIISAVQIVIDLFGQWMDIWADDDMDIGTKILKSLVAVPTAIWNGLIQPLVDGLDWVFKKMGITFSIGDFLKSMYNDIVDLGSRIFMPFADAWIGFMKVFDEGGGIGWLILEGILQVSAAIGKALVFPFFWALDKITNWWLGQSPSGIGLAILDGIKSVGSMVLDVLTWPFRTAWNFISKIFGGDGDLGNCIIDGIKSISSQILDCIVWPFTSAWAKIKEIFGTMSPELVDGIIKGIASAGGALLDAITSPFRAAFDFIKNIFSNIGDLLNKIPFVNKIFGAAQDAAANVGNQVKSSVEMATTSVVEIKNLDSLKEVVAQLTAAVVKLGGAAGGGSTVFNAPANDNSAMIAKLDELIGLLKAGGIAVNLDGRKVSSGLSVAGR